MTDPLAMSQPAIELSLEERLALIKTLNGLPISQLVELEVALDIPNGVMPAPTIEKGLWNRALLGWIEGSTGVGFSRFFGILEKATGISLDTIKANSPQRLAFTLAGEVSKADVPFLMEILQALQEKAKDSSLALSYAEEGSIRLHLQGSSEGLKRLQELFLSGELTNIKDREVRSARLFLDLSGASLRGADLSRVNLSNAVLSSASLSNVNLWRADLNGANLVSANLSYADLREANLSGADLSRADFSRADMSNAILSHTVFSNADLSNAVLIEANLIDVNLSGAIVEGTNFGVGRGLTASEKADLQRRGAIFTNPPDSEVPAFVNR